AEESLEALEDYAPAECTVIRSNTVMEINKEDIVPGDILVLKPGSRVGADARLLKSDLLKLEEAALTGESMPVSKEASLVLEYNVSLSERKNMVYAGTLVTRGQGTAVVVATGMSTEIGRIAGLVTSAETQKTPLETRLEFLGRILL